MCIFTTSPCSLHDGNIALLMTSIQVSRAISLKLSTTSDISNHVQFIAYISIVIRYFFACGHAG